MPAADLDWKAVAARISQRTEAVFTVEQAQPLGGGSINRAWRIDGTGRRFFVKLNAAEQIAMFEAEFAGLQALHEAAAVRVPRPICSGRDGAHAWLVLEYLELRQARPGEWAGLGERLARQHRVTAPLFGWHRDNTIGATPQHNAQQPDWIHFFASCRLRFQLDLAARNGYARTLADEGAQLLEALPAFFSGYAPLPSLLHGDLWSGNAGFCDSAGPVLFDPAVYYGDREADLAMSELFGGFDREFYSAYRADWAIDPGYAVRKRLYNLYHLLNHLNLFGGGYLADCRDTIRWLLARC
jgi:protein-ribulosamine 3-kinase